MRMVSQLLIALALTSCMVQLSQALPAADNMLMERDGLPLVGKRQVDENSLTEISETTTKTKSKKEGKSKGKGREKGSKAAKKPNGGNNIFDWIG
ncbi:hypothetical protein MBANPS3_005515 [Mucor bainieri]